MFLHIPENSKRYPKKAYEEFIGLAKYFLFLATFEPIVTPSRLNEKISQIIQSAGKPENIEMWRCWTPNQLPLLTGKAPKVMFLSAPSTGKTTLMEAKAYQCLLDQMVAFLIPFAFKRVKSPPRFTRHLKYL